MTDTLRAAGQRGKFIVFEGPDGVGKTTQAEILRDRLGAGGANVLLTKEPTDTELGKLALAELGRGSSSHKVAMLMVADRWEHYQSVINPALQEGKIVICDRYQLSTHIYQTLDLFVEMQRALTSSALTDDDDDRAGDPWSAASIAREGHALGDTVNAANELVRSNEWMSKLHIGLPAPDLYVLLMSDPRSLLNRVEARGGDISDQDIKTALYSSYYSFFVHRPHVLQVAVNDLAVVITQDSAEATADQVFNACAQVL